MHITYPIHKIQVIQVIRAIYTIHTGYNITHTIRTAALLLIIVIVSAGMWGCSSAGTITFSEPATLSPHYQPTTSISTSPRTIQYRAGTITSTTPQYSSYATFAWQYLKKILTGNRIKDTATTPKPAASSDNPATPPLPAVHNPTRIIAGRLTIKQLAAATSPARKATTVQLRLYVKDDNNNVIRQVWLTRTAQTAATDNNALIKQIITQQINSFIKTVPAGYIIRKIKLATGHSPYARQAARLASQGKLQQALNLLRQAIDDHPWDHASIYNAGLCSEALGRYQQAYNYYNRAWQTKKIKQYKAALTRVNTLLNKNTNNKE